ncbi:transcription elongation factor GreA [bacterium]|uniref:Transcription elongation factor GreA n=2 Tax=Katanobacteria TaxID=422282 RepID=A0A2M7X149_UNCKA|nr:transcription elongation factor GreA [bacterium]PIP56558.1 MAG: transcription elongation factor GreA [candidate division WWE3 bacterium CG22_combo_CG10-13_8_21_14_all_39_12]PJA39905.1 MAG: transcription elongation factor GreA [candidate division WWE3 bacterium CG_4_9_14_3_um_filter_39_7]
MDDHTYYVTREGYNNLLDEKKRLQAESKPKALVRVKHARDMGSLEDNDEYNAAREALNLIEGRLLELTEVLEKVQVVDKSDIAGKAHIELGSTITVDVRGKEQTLTIVGSIEADPTIGRVSHESPVGTSLMGLKEGDIVEIKLPHTSVEYKIIKIHS